MNKKIDVKEFWTRNLNGLKHLSAYPDSIEDFDEASRIRYQYHYHLPGVFKALAQRYPQGRLLEIGCGMGADTVELLKKGFEVTAIDLTEPAIECTRNRIELYGFDGVVERGDAEKLKYDDRTFDVVYSFGVLHHSPDTSLTINEVLRVLKPGGLASIMLYNRKSLNYVIHRLLKYPFDGNKKDPCPVESTYSKNEVLEMFRHYSKCNIETEYLFGTGYKILNNITPKIVHRKLGKLVGWHLMIDAIK